MRTALILVLLTAAMMFSGCGDKAAANLDSNANTPANAETGTTSSFANITDSSAALAEGNRLLDENKTELAIEAFKRAVEIEPGLAEAHFKLGIAYALVEAEMVQSGVDANADNDSKKAAPKTNSQKEFEKAVAAYKKLLAANSKDDVAQFNLGRAYNKLNEDDDAEDAFRAAVKLKPDDTEYQTELGAILIKLAKYHEAIPPLKKALELDAENSRADKLLEDAEAGAKRVDFGQNDNKDTKKVISNSASTSNSSSSNGNTSGSSNSPVKQPDAPAKPRKDDAKDKHPEKTPSKTPNRHD